jgi:hypothetical protein
MCHGLAICFQKEFPSLDQITELLNLTTDTATKSTPHTTDLHDIGKEVRFIGMIGSRRTALLILSRTGNENFQITLDLLCLFHFERMQNSK